MVTLRPAMIRSDAIFGSSVNDSKLASDRTTSGIQTTAISQIASLDIVSKRSPRSRNAFSLGYDFLLALLFAVTSALIFIASLLLHGIELRSYASVRRIGGNNVRDSTYSAWLAKTHGAALMNRSE